MYGRDAQAGRFLSHSIFWRLFSSNCVLRKPEFAWPLASSSEVPVHWWQQQVHCCTKTCVGLLGRRTMEARACAGAKRKFLVSSNQIFLSRRFSFDDRALLPLQLWKVWFIWFICYRTAVLPAFLACASEINAIWIRQSLFGIGMSCSPP